jgi:alcohol dehydrogenase (NADP+)
LARIAGRLPFEKPSFNSCGKHNITSDVEVIAIQQINEAYERLLKADVKYRFSIDMTSLKAE